MPKEQTKIRRDNMEKLTDKEKRKIIGEVTKTLNDDDKLIIVITDDGHTVARGEAVDIGAALLGLLRKIKDSNIMGRMIVEAITEELKEADPEDYISEAIKDLQELIK